MNCHRLQLVDLVSLVFCVHFPLIQGVPLSLVPAFLFSLLLDVSRWHQIFFLEALIFLVHLTLDRLIMMSFQDWSWKMVGEGALQV
jgi:hypothetical protein